MQTPICRKVSPKSPKSPADAPFGGFGGTFLTKAAGKKGQKPMTALEELREMRRQKERRECTEPSPKSPRTSGMTLAQFAGSGLLLRIHSDVLGEEVVFAADNAPVSVAEPRPVYRARELAVIWGEDGSISADGLRLLHEVKVRFAGEVTSDISNQTEERPEA